MASMNDDTSDTPQMSNGSIVQLGHFSALQRAVLALNSTFLVLATVAVVMRFWSRSIKGLSLVVNDVVAVVALIFLYGFFALMVYGLCVGIGRQIVQLQDPRLQLPQIYKLLVPLPILWSTINTLVKVSVLDLYIRVFPPKSFRVGSYIVLGLSCTYWVIAILFAFLNCHPFSYTWDKSQPGGHCADYQGGTLGFGIANLILDLTIIILPLPYLYTLKLKLMKRVSLIGIFALGFVITAISAVRIHAIVTATQTSFPYGAAHIGLWSFLETSLSIINCCLPTIQPALTNVASFMRRVVIGPPGVDEFSHSSGQGGSGHRFVTLGSPRSSEVVGPPLVSQHSQRYPDPHMIRGKHDIPLEARPRNGTFGSGRGWKPEYAVGETMVDPEGYSASSIRETRDRPRDLSSGAKDINVRREWSVDSTERAYFAGRMV